MVLSNEKKRRQFIEDTANWEEIPTASNFVRMRKLLYKGHMWLALDVWQTYTNYDMNKRQMVEVTEWSLLHYYTLNEHTHALGWPVSLTQIIEDIKAIDKEEKK